MKKIIWIPFYIFAMLSFSHSLWAADSATAQVNLLNSQIQDQLQKLQEKQQKQMKDLNAQIQTQLQQMQANLQAQIQKVNTQTQAQMKQLQDALHQQIQQIQNQSTEKEVAPPSMPPSP